MDLRDHRSGGALIAGGVAREITGENLAGNGLAQELLADRHGTNRQHELGAVRVLEHVAVGARVQGGPNVLLVLVRRQHQFARSRGKPLDLGEQLDSGSPRQREVGHHDIGLQFTDAGETQFRAGEFADDVEIGFHHDQGLEALPQDRMIFDQDNARVRGGLISEPTCIHFSRP